MRRIQRRALLVGALSGLLLAMPGAAQPEANPPEAGSPPASDLAERPPGHGPGHGRRGPGGDGHRLERLVEKLDLDDATLETVYAVIDDSRTRQREARRELRDAHASMRELLAADAPDEDAVFSQLDLIGELKTQLDKERLGTLLRVRALLPDDARTQLLALMRKGREHHRGRFSEKRGRW